MIRVVIAEDHHLVRQGIRALLEKTGEIAVVGEAADGQDAVELTRRLIPDLVMLDISMPRLNGIEAVRRIHALGTNSRVMVLSMYADETLVRQALQSGARGYVVKRAVAEELVLAIRAIARGEVFLSPEVSRVLLDQAVGRREAADGEGPLAHLTSREREVLQLVAEGHTNSRIAGMLCLSEKTVEKHRGSLMVKLDAHNTAGLVRLAVKHGLIRLDG
jgi:DNA-binding NarL/FixJ family response regulator